MGLPPTAPAGPLLLLRGANNALKHMPGHQAAPAAAARWQARPACSPNGLQTNANEDQVISWSPGREE
jgi:hypothetical protein